MTKLPTFFALLLLPLVASCSQGSLPGREPLPEDFARFSKEAEIYASEAKTSAELARNEVERSEMLLEEARALLLQANSAEAKCRDLISKIPKKKRRIYRARKKKVAPKKETKTPEYSPSDAPPVKSTPAT